MRLMLVIALLALAAAPVALAQEATETPIATPEPFVVRWTAQDVVDAFVAAGLECVDPRPMAAYDFWFFEHMTLDGQYFYLPSLCPHCGARVFAFVDPDDLAITRIYYTKLGEGIPLLFSWVFVQDNVVVQMNGKLPEEQARAYEAALMGMGAGGYDDVLSAARHLSVRVHLDEHESILLGHVVEDVYQNANAKYQKPQ